MLYVVNVDMCSVVPAAVPVVAVIVRDIVGVDDYRFSCDSADGHVRKIGGIIIDVLVRSGRRTCDLLQVIGLSGH